MNPPWHFLIAHGFKFFIIAMALLGRYLKYHQKQTEKEKALRRPQSAPAAPMMAPQTLNETTKNDKSPWSNADPFNSQRPRR